MTQFFDPALFLGEFPEPVFQETVERRQPAGRHRFFSKMFADLQADYLKEIAAFTRSSGRSPLSSPKLRSWTDYLEQLDFDEPYFRTPQAQRRPGMPPVARFLFPT